ncbi:MAG: type II secretion system F family protein [Ilumatobacteraceae bacterium]|jgi:tight adherence protein C
MALILLPTFSADVRRRMERLVSNSRQIVQQRTARAHSSDLDIVGWTPSDLVARQLLGVVLGVAVGATASSMMTRGLTVMAAMISGGTAGCAVPVAMLRASARARRRSFVHAFSAYLDLVNVLLAGGAGIETALIAAADAGDGWAFGTLRTSLARARLLRRSPWSELRALGSRWSIAEVVEVAGSMNLSGEHGARIRTSLAARADSMRSRQVAEIEALAQSATERMGVPVMMLFVGFMVLLGYPALQTVVMTM